MPLAESLTSSVRGYLSVERFHLVSFIERLSSLWSFLWIIILPILEGWREGVSMEQGTGGEWGHSSLPTPLSPPLHSSPFHSHSPTSVHLPYLELYLEVLDYNITVLTHTLARQHITTHCDFMCFPTFLSEQTKTSVLISADTPEEGPFDGCEYSLSVSQCVSYWKLWWTHWNEALPLLRAPQMSSLQN